MLGRMLRRFRQLLTRGNLSAPSQGGPDAPPPDDPILDGAAAAVALREALGASADVGFRPFVLPDGSRSGVLVYLDSMARETDVSGRVLRPLLRPHAEAPRPAGDADPLLWLGMTRLESSAFSHAATLAEALDGVLRGRVALFLDGAPGALLLSTEGPRTRQVGKPTTEAVLRGPLEGFTESCTVNLGLIRRRLKDADLRAQAEVVGRRTRTRVLVLHIHGLTNPEWPAEVRRRLQAIDIDGIHDSGDLANLLAGGGWQVLPSFLLTERTDRVAAGLLEGRVAIVVDGSPYALLGPALFFDFWRSPEDYYFPPLTSMATRFIRLFGTLINILLPGLYVAFVNVNPGLIQTPLAISIAASREGIPFAPVVEALLMLLMLELMIEASARLPRIVGGATTIVGGLIIGEVAVRAKLASDAMVIVVAMTAIANFTVPEYSLGPPMRLMKYWILLWANFFGLIGIVLATVWTTAYIGSHRPLGVPFLSGLGPFRVSELADSLFMLPEAYRTRRPRSFRPVDPQRHSPVPRRRTAHD